MLDVDIALRRVRAQAPLVHHITNWVTIYDCAQAVKALGASPVMAHANEEAADMVALASSLVLNIGTLTPSLIAAMKTAALAAHARAIPVILDVCGAGATPLRTEKTDELLDTGAISIIKGNASEIAAVAGLAVTTKGVDSGTVDADLQSVARTLARARGACVVATGAVDLITDGQTVYRIANGHPIMATVVGTGCMAASVIGTFAAVEPDGAKAAAAALIAYEVAAEQAAQTATAPMAFKAALLDALYGLDGAVAAAQAKIESQT